MKRLAIVLTVVGALALLTLSTPVYAAGWYLLTPPVTDRGNALIGGRTFDPDAPLSLWRNQGSYDSAVECEAWKVRPEFFHAPMGMSPIEAAWVQENFAQILTYAKCTASDDPRLRIAN
jgi:hypothetical protein